MSTNIAFSKNVVEFVTVGVQYCTQIEQVSGKDKNEFVDTVLKLLPLLYLKASLLPKSDEYDDNIEQFVNEETYEYLRSSIENVLGKNDAYLEVFQSDMQYSDTPIAAFISEDLTDVYQDIKNCISVYELGNEETMTDAVYLCENNFEQYWGQKLVNVLRALHTVRYSIDADDEFPEMDEDNEWSKWNE